MTHQTYAVKNTAIAIFNEQNTNLNNTKQAYGNNQSKKPS